MCRSRKGAWIEINYWEPTEGNAKGRSRKGAWIEMPNPSRSTTQSECRSRKGAWIEISVRAEFDNDPRVAPARERGLK